MLKKPSKKHQNYIMLEKYLKKGAHNTLFYGISSVVSRAFSFLFLPYFLARLSLAEFGIWDFYQMFFSFGTLMLSSSAATGMIRFYLLHKDNPHKQRQSIGNALLFIGLLALVFQLSIVPVFKLWGSTHQNLNYLFVTSCNISLFALFSILLAYFRVKEYLWLYFFAFCGQSFLAIAMTVCAVHAGFGIDGFFYANGISFLLFFPGFAYLAVTHRDYSLELLKQQLRYSLPLLVYSLLYSCFFSIDRFFIKAYSGYESLGTYALLWRFGSIFQFFSVALMDASPIVLFNAQKEANCDQLIARLINYFCLTLATACLLSVVGSIVGITLFFPAKYQFLSTLVPFFFLPLVIIECARMLQAGIGLSKKTIYCPLLISIGLVVQVTLLFACIPLGLPGFLAANSVSFAILAALAYWTSTHVYSPHMFDRTKLTRLATLFFAHIALLQGIVFTKLSYAWFVFSMLSWPAFVWRFVIGSAEKQKVGQWLSQKLHALISRRKKQPISHVKTVLYLKTDIYYHHIIAGGSFSHTLGVLRGFIRSKVDVICATASMQQELQALRLNYLQPLRVWPIFFFVRWKIGFLRWHADCLLSTISFAMQTWRLFKQYPFDAIYQRYSWLNTTGLVLSFVTKVPLILEYNGSEVAIAQQSGQHSYGFLWLAQALERLNLTYADHIIVVSEVQREELINQDINPAKILVNPNGVDHESFNPELFTTTRTGVRQTLGIKDSFVFGFVGTFSFWHGIDLLAHIMPAIIAANKRVHFLLIGDGPRKALVDKVAKDFPKYVTLPGMLSQTITKEYLAACDAYLCPTQPLQHGKRFFGSPTKLFEYMSMAKPIIASNIEHISDIINPALSAMQLDTQPITDEIAIAADPTRSEEFVRAAYFLSTANAQTLQTLGTNARRKVARSLTWNHHVQTICDFVER